MNDEYDQAFSGACLGVITLMIEIWITFSFGLALIWGGASLAFICLAEIYLRALTR